MSFLPIGLLGLALLQTTSLNNQLEAYQRAQALLLLEDMANRIRVNSVAARDTDAPVSGRRSDPALPEEDCSTVSRMMQVNDGRAGFV